ncbi:hypothetical protein PHYPSEUDO_005062 [Phytophthora pseudosyringae]|uniref:RxLR effector protein n=1 Tax=Phytophthora pseudosyringae TaxID=221518 RepID=A0A8T1VS63_9STRA|nr:hypothetical protein PHYPSEUDO_005062 [Phytophthora pseudosyringae]
MKLYHVALESTLTSPGAATRVLQNNTPTKRLLRAHIIEDEERAVLPQSLTKLFKRSSKTKELQGLLKADESLDNAFNTLGLSNMPVSKNDFIETKMVAQLFSSRNFKVWSQHAVNLKNQDPNGAMLAALTNVFGEKNVATMILLGKHSRSSSKVAKKLEQAQFNKWYATDGLTADEVFTKVLKQKRADIHMYARDKLIWIDYSKYITKRVEKY